MKHMIVAVLILGSVTISNAAGKEATGADATAVNAACSADAGTAGCGSEKVGTGLLKCLHAYKKANKDFKFSEGCKSAMHKMHEDKKSK